MSKAQKERLQRIRQAMTPLFGDTRFQSFIEEIRQMQQAAMIDACNERVVASERLSLAALGEVRAYQGIIDTYQGHVDAAEAESGG